VQAVFGERIAPGLLDRYLARTGYDSQLTDEPLDGEREGNLFQPVPGDFGSHGRYDDRARPRSLLLDLNLRARRLVGR
jgi:hypothetical protein